MAQNLSNGLTDEELRASPLGVDVGNIRTTRHGSLVADARFVDVAADFYDQVATNEVIKVSGDDPTQTGSKANFSNGEWRSLENCRYRHGRTTELTCSAAFTGTPAVGEFALMGVADETGENAFLFGSKDGEDVFIFRRAGVEEITLTRSASEWVDPLDGTGDFAEAWDRAKANVWALPFIWHGNGPAGLDLLGTSTEGYKNVANLQLNNNREDASLENPDVFVWIEASANMAVSTSSWALGAYLPARDIKVSQGNSYSDTLAAGATFTGQWSDLADFAQVNTVIMSDKTVTMEHEYSTNRSDVLDGVVPQFFHSGDSRTRFFPLGIHGRYFRVKMTNTSVDPADLTVQTLLLPQQSNSTTVRIGDALTQDKSAEVVKAVVSGFTPAEEAVNIPVGGIDPGNSTQDNLGISGTYTGEYQRTSGYSSALVFALSNVPLDTVRVQWSEDGVNPRTGLIGTSNLTEVETGGFYIYLSTLTTMIDQYMRLEVVNGTTATSLFEADTWLYDSPFPGSYGALDANLSAISTALLTRSVQAGVTPYGDFVNRPEGGEAYRYATNKVDANGDPDYDAPLLADEEIVTPWISVQGHASLEIFATSDVQSAPDGIRVEYSPDENIPDSEQYTAPDFFEFRDQTFSAGKFSTAIRPRRSFVRIAYKNNATTDQTRFEFTIGLNPASKELPRTSLDAQLTPLSEAVTTKGGLVASDDAKDIQPIGRDGEGVGALNVHLRAMDDDVEVKQSATTKLHSDQLTISDTVVKNVPVPAGMTLPKTVRLSHPGGEGFPLIYFRSGSQPAVTSLNGDFIFPGTSVELDYDGAESEPQVIMGTPETPIASEQADLAIDTVDSNSGVTNPTNAYASGGGYAVFDAASDTVTYSGLNATGLLTADDISSVILRATARKEPGAAAEVMAYTDIVSGSPSLISSGSTGGGSPIPTPELNAVAGVTYFVVIARENTGATVTNVTNTMGFDAYDVSHLIRDVNNGGESRHSVIKMSGTPTSSGVINVFLSAASSHDVITVIGVTNFGAVQASNQFTTTNGGSFSVPNTAGTANGLAIGVVAAEIANTNTPVTNFTTREQGGSAANDDQTLWVGTRTTPSTTNYTLVGTTDDGTNDDITASLITLMPSDATNPVLEVTVTADGGALPNTLEMTLSAETDTEYELDITDQAAWTKAILDAATFAVEATTVGNADAQLDHLEVDAEATSNALRMGYTWVGD